MPYAKLPISTEEADISFWILVFDIHLAFGFWHLTLNVQDFRLGPLIGAIQRQMLWVWVRYLSITTVANLPVVPSAR